MNKEKILKSVNIFNEKYDVEVLNLNIGITEGKVNGQITYSQTKIQLEEDQSDENVKTTLLHEIIHGYLVSLGMRDINEDEQTVCLLTTMVKDMMLNKELVSFIQK